MTNDQSQIGSAEIGLRLSESRRKRGLKQKDAAVALSIKQPYLSQIENGRINPSLDLLIKICKLYTESSDWLILGKKPDDYIENLGNMALPYSDIIYDLQRLNANDVEEIRQHINGLLSERSESEVE